MAEIYTEGLNFEKVWAAIKASSEETDRKIREVAELQKETEQKMKETDRQIGKLGNRFGDLVEHLVVPGIVEKFNALGFHFIDVSQSRKYKDPLTLRPLAEVDIVLENSDFVMAVEVKSNLRTEYVNGHLERMEALRRLADMRGDKRKYRGALATAVTTDEARTYAQKSGFYVLEQSGDMMKLDIPEGFVARDW